MIKVINLRKKFGKSIILNDVSFEIKEGIIIGVIGKNGAGKTTLFRCILNICQFENGKIVNSSKNRKVIFDVAPKLKKFTVLQYLKYFTLLYDEKTDNQDGMDIDAILTKINLIRFKNRKVSELSFGMKKLLYISTLLVGKTEFAVVDEPFNGLDEKSRDIVKNILVDLKRKYNATVVVSSHQHEQLDDICDCYLEVGKGNVNYIPFYKESTRIEMLFDDDEGILEFYKKKYADEAAMKDLDCMKMAIGKCLFEKPEKFTLKCIDKNVKGSSYEVF